MGKVVTMVEQVYIEPEEDCPPLKKRPGELPLDYEPCGDCGFDHDYDYPAAAEWHTANPGSYS